MFRADTLTLPSVWWAIDKELPLLPNGIVQPLFNVVGLRLSACPLSLSWRDDRAGPGHRAFSRRQRRRGCFIFLRVRGL